MRIFRFILPFLFERNWHTGAWELSRVRLIIFCAGIALCLLGLFVAYMLQAPVVYTTPS